MKYWIGKKGTNKEGEYGCMDDNGYVPDSEHLERPQYDSMCIYDEFLSVTEEESDIEKLVKWAKKEGHI